MFVGFCAEQRPLATMLSMRGWQAVPATRSHDTRPLTGAYYFIP
jgi:hypothetical protein